MVSIIQEQSHDFNNFHRVLAGDKYSFSDFNIIMRNSLSFTNSYWCWESMMKPIYNSIADADGLDTSKFLWWRIDCLSKKPEGL